MTAFSFDVLAHAALTPADLVRLARLFDGEYQQDFGPWNPDQPYGYAGHDVHVLARLGEDVVGHVGWARRVIRVGGTDVAIAGVGGVLVSDRARGGEVGRRMMRRAAESTAEAGGVSFGYLGCREEVVAFYTACGWHRITAAERSIGRTGERVFDEPGQPLLVLPVEGELSQWPTGEVDLRGRAW